MKSCRLVRFLDPAGAHRSRCDDRLRILGQDPPVVVVVVVAAASQAPPQATADATWAASTERYRKAKKGVPGPFPSGL